MTQPVQGAVVVPSPGPEDGAPIAARAAYATSARDSAVHGLANVLRELIHMNQHFPSEGAKLSAQAAVDNWEKQHVGSLAGINREQDTAPVEDVTQRVPPMVGAMPAPIPGLDYNKLAEALVSAQQRAVGGQ